MAMKNMAMKEIVPNVYVSTEIHNIIHINVGLIALPHGVIAVDVPTLPTDARTWREQIRQIGKGPLLYIVLTDGHPDRLLSLDILRGDDPVPVVATWPAYGRVASYTDGFWRSVVDMWNRRVPGVADEVSPEKENRPLPEMMFTGKLTLHKGGEDVVLKQVSGAAPGSLWVHVVSAGQEVVFVGDTLVVGEHPVMSAAPDTGKWLETLVDLRRVRHAGRIIVPGRGRSPADPADSRPLSDYIATIRRRVSSMLRRGEYSRPDVAALVSELLPYFPVPDDALDLIQRRVKANVEQVYAELRSLQSE